MMYMLGGDFSFVNAHRTFDNADKFIEYVNSNYDNVTIFYSTPGTYFDTLKKLQNENLSFAWPTNYFDFLPYAQYPKK